MNPRDHSVPIKNPPHPGDFIRTEIIEPAGLSVTAAATALQLSRPALSSLLNGRADLSGDMARRIEKAFGVRMDTLMRMQSAYDIVRTRKRRTTPTAKARSARLPMDRAPPSVRAGNDSDACILDKEEQSVGKSPHSGVPISLSTTE
jgi:addiction module HigA family antidote